MVDLKATLRQFGVKQVQVAKAAGRTPGRVSQWMSGKEPIPADLVPAIERETGLPRHLLRPDLWTAPAEAAAA